VVALLESQPILTLFLVIGLGYAAGDLAIAGFSLGVGAVLFVGLAIGAIAPAAAPPALLSSVGLIVFFYGIGIQYGRDCIAGLTRASSWRQTSLAIAGVFVAGAVLVGLLALLQLPVELGAGLFSGALVSTASLEAAISQLGSEVPIVGYGVAYPFGVFGPIACLYLALRLLSPALPKPPARGVEGVDVTVSHPDAAGLLLSDVVARLPAEVQVIAVRQHGVNRLPRGTLRLCIGDVLTVEAQGEALEQTRSLLGEATSFDPLIDLDDLDELTVYVSNPAIVNRKLGELTLAETPGCAAIAVLRGDSELYPQPGLVLEAGDQLRVVADRDRVAAVQDFFGNSARSLSEVSYLSLGLGMVLGVLFGLIPIPIPGVGAVSFGAAGGALIVSLVLGWRERTGRIVWTMPPAANLTLRNFGLTLFLAVAGLRSAEQFVQTVQETGLQLLLVGIAITLATVLFVLFVGYFLLRSPFDTLSGTIAGVTGNPAILAYACKIVPTNQPELGYAIAFPVTTIVKIVVVQVVLAWLA